ncbi:MAG: phosphonate ABC transporter, permease protein PhnE, partial [Deltaproteobacteria bacterium]|nr:phosphonate ABC transporter, permease protein PhnE [Deltaproteobacteria bacterium]
MTEARRWQRFTMAERLARFSVYLGTVALFVFSLKTVQIIPEFLWDAPEQMADLFRRMWPPDWPSYTSQGVHEALIETLNIAGLGTLLAIFLSVPVGLMGASNITRSGILNWLARLILVSSRSVNTLVWAIL